jgi:hypothetical protein
MIILASQNDFQKVASLPFCYWCGTDFQVGDKFNGDHVPPKNAFAETDRTPPLKLKTHIACNSTHKTNDELIGQLVGLRRDHVTPYPKNRRLKMEVYPGQAFGSVTNVNVIEAVWRYIRAFHAALYQTPLPGKPAGIMTTPFTRAYLENGELILEGPNQQQHFTIVKTIKAQRALGNIDRITANNGKLIYECVWVWADDAAPVTAGLRSPSPRRACFFALDIYDWKELGNIGQFSARGCVGAYFSPDGQSPKGAANHIETTMDIQNLDPWDPFGP